MSTLPPESAPTDLELKFIEDEPPGLFPQNQDSFWGQVRKVLTDKLQEVADLSATYYMNQSALTVNDDDMDEWEQMLGIPTQAGGRSLEQRRTFVLSRMTYGPFTRTRRAAIVERFIRATFGTSPALTVGGLPIPATGIPLYSDVTDTVGTYNIIENITGFSYQVFIRDDISVDLAGLTRELAHITPAGITFTVASVHDPFMAKTGNLTVSGNEITDLKRLAALAWGTGQQGGSTDGAATPGGMAVWEAGTNLFTHGQCDSTASCFLATGGETISIDATTPAQFSPQSFKVVTPGLLAQEGVIMEGVGGQAAAAGVNAVGSTRFKGTNGATYFAQIRWRNTDASNTTGAFATFNGTGAWQTLDSIIGAVAVAAGKTGDAIWVRVGINGTRAEAFWVAHPMFQKGVTIVSPYVATSGGATATRAISRIQVTPSTLVSEAQGALAVCSTVGYSSAAGNFGGASKYLFDARIDANNRLVANVLGTQIAFYNIVAGSTANFLPVFVPFNFGDRILVIAKWDATTITIYVSINGGAFSTASIARVGVPVGATTAFDFGSNNGGGQWLDGTLKWAVIAQTFTADDLAAAIAAGTTPPRFSNFSAGAQVAAIIPFDDNNYYVPR